MMVQYFNQRVNKLELMWFVDRVFAIGGYDPVYPFKTNLAFYVRPKYGLDLIKFNVKHCPITGDFDIDNTIDKMYNHFNMRRRIYWNIKTFFAHIKTIL